jgi:hypothetical protein
MKYQDIWINGQVTESGKRECAERYEIIKQFCTTLKQPFTVCDIGANMAYFGLRLIDDFDCYVIAFEFHQFEERAKIISLNKTTKLIYMNRKISLNDLDILKQFCHFNLILALSVLHHVPGSVKQWIEKLREFTDNLIIEVALSDSKRTETRKEYFIPEGKILGYGDSHLKTNFKRPIILL